MCGAIVGAVVWFAAVLGATVGAWVRLLAAGVGANVVFGASVPLLLGAMVGVRVAFVGSF